MPRPKEYDREEVLKTATQLFLEKGFVGTSMTALVHVTGVQRRSMYNEFNNKDGLFLACIDSYLNTTSKDLVVILRQKPRGIRNIEAFLRDRIEYASSGGCKGCLLVNTAIEKELISKQIQDKVIESLKSTEKELQNCLKAAQERGELGTGKSCSSLAKYLMCFLEGLMVMGKTNPSKKSLEPVIESVLAALTH